MRVALTVAAVAAVLAQSPLAQALQVQTQASAQRVSVGEAFVVQLVVMNDGQGDQSLTDAHLALPPGMTATRPTASPQSQVSIVNGQMSQRAGYTVTWRVTASKVGEFKLGPPSVTMGGQQARGQVVPIEVVAADPGGAQPRRQRGFDPFDLLDPLGRGNGGFPPGFNFRSPFDDDASEQQPDVPQYPDELRVDKAADPIAFLRATATPSEVVVGQQVTLRVFAYGGHGLFSVESPREPSHADFLAYESGPMSGQPYTVPIGEAHFVGAKLLEQALFPLHAGTLRAGHMKMGFGGRGYPVNQAGQALTRESNWVDVIVSEPPLRGRPPGYKVGDVGEYKLSASVEPHQVVAGEAVSVVATLSGVGMVPFKVQNPEGHGVEWLEPALSEKLEAPGGVVQGSRTFSYVVRMLDSGKVDLGELTLPYYDPKRHAYAIARAALGEVLVKPNPKAAAASAREKPTDRLEGVLKARDSLGAWSSASAPLSDRGGFWAALFLAPLGVVFAGGALSVATRTRHKLRERGASLPAQLEAALREGRELAKSDTKGSVAALERAVFLAIELKLQLKARAILKTELAANLTERGLRSARAGALVQLLQDCDTLRFVGPASGIDIAELAQRATQHCAELRADKLTEPS